MYFCTIMPLQGASRAGQRSWNAASGRFRHRAMSMDGQVPQAQDALERPSRDTSASMRVAWMHSSGSRILGGMLGVCLFLLTGSTANAVEKQPSLAKTGFLLIAPDRGFLGNQDIQDVFAEFKSSYPAALAFTGREYSGTGGDYSGYLILLCHISFQRCR